MVASLFDELFFCRSVVIQNVNKAFYRNDITLKIKVTCFTS